MCNPNLFSSIFKINFRKVILMDKFRRCIASRVRMRIQRGALMGKYRFVHEEKDMA